MDEYEKDLADTEDKKSRYSKVAIISFIIAIIGAVIFTMSGFGYHLKIWGLGLAFGFLKWGAFISMFGILITIFGIYFSHPGRNNRGFGYAVFGLLLSMAVTGTALFFYNRAVNAPPIHDITTDTANPPKFKAVLPMRAHSPNGYKYGGAKVAALQHKYYPNIKPLYLKVSPGVAYHKALVAAHEMSWWKIDAADSLQDRIEATSTIPWFGFKDDIIVRIDTLMKGSKIDVRSESRIGVSDIGENARRIRSYIKKIKAEG